VLRPLLLLTLGLGLIASDASGQPAGDTAVPPWEYARWGMSPDEVLAAAGGAATLVGPSTTHSALAVRLYAGLMVSAPWAADGITYLTFFLFELRDTPSPLRQITMWPNDPLDCAGMLGGLTARWGQGTPGTFLAFATSEFEADYGWIIFYNLPGVRAGCAMTITPNRLPAR
jgi:hypothetical protein